jgi:two-component system OmpR family sensor kinase
VSLRLRILLATVVALMAGLLVVDVVTYTTFARSQLGQVDDALQRAHTPTEQLASGDPGLWSSIPEVAPGLFVAIVDPAGSALFTAGAREPGHREATVEIAAIDLGTRRQTVPASDGHDMRLRVDPLPDGSTLVVGQQLHEIDETRQGLLAVLITASAAAVAIVVALSWWLIGLGLRPLRRVETSAAAITDQALGDARVPGADHNTEVGRLAAALNAMLDRLDAARADRERTLVDLTASEARMRQFVADASHELRTPMAATAAYAELFEKGARDRPDDLERSMTGIRRETARMAELVDDLLLLARLDEKRPLAIDTVDLTELVLTAVDAARTLEPERRWTTQIAGVVLVEGDAARLRQVIDNILTNVRAHAPLDAECTIDLSTAGADAVLVVADDGPGVSDDRLAHLTDRFYRIDEARTRATGGSGLGLSIATAIVEAHRGTLTAGRNEPHGLRIRVTIPVHGDSGPDAVVE